MLVGMINVRRVTLQSTLRRLLGIFTDGAVENVWELRGDFIEGVRADAKVLGQDFLWGM